MTARTPLPSTLAAGAFTTAELHAAGLPWRRTLAADLARICRGVHTAGIPDPCAPDGAAALVRLTGGVVSTSLPPSGTDCRCRPASRGQPDCT